MAAREAAMKKMLFVAVVGLLALAAGCAFTPWVGMERPRLVAALGEPWTIGIQDVFFEGDTAYVVSYDDHGRVKTFERHPVEMRALPTGSVAR